MRFLKPLAFLALALLATRLPAIEALGPGLYAEFTTPRGSFVVDLDYRHVPMTVTSFVGLAEGTIAARNGQPFYTGLKWFRVVPGFVIQGGDPDHYANRDTEKDSAPYTLPDEFVPGRHHNAAGVLSMANAGPDTNSTQFFLTLGDSTRLNYLHSVFGRVHLGLEVLPLVQADDPFSIRIIRVGDAARAFKADEATLQALVARAKKYSGAAEPGPTAHFDDPDKLIPVEPPRAKAFNFKLANYERATGLKIVARLSGSPPPATEDDKPGAYMKGLATKLGVAQTGVLVAFFAPDDWRVWIGDDLVPVFLGRPVAAGDLGEGGKLHDAKEALITAALKSGDDAFAAQKAAAEKAGRDAPPAAQHLKLQVDALLDALLLRFEPKR
jgi:cyclophilin family peptidyl-prolyl cis-trans isomerase